MHTVEIIALSDWLAAYPCNGKTESIVNFASKFGVSVPTAYRWLKSGEYCVIGDGEGNDYSVVRVVATKEAGK